MMALSFSMVLTSVDLLYQVMDPEYYFPSIVGQFRLKQAVVPILLAVLIAIVSSAFLSILSLIVSSSTIISLGFLLSAGTCSYFITKLSALILEKSERIS